MIHGLPGLFDPSDLCEWKSLAGELSKPYMQELETVLLPRRFCPDPKDIFRAFRLTHLDDVRVVIVGQDPYATPGLACGLAFSIREPLPSGIRRPPSAGRILNRVSASIGCGRITGRDLRQWACNGVLLLNSVLTVDENDPGSHRGLGWECFTNRALQLVNEQSNRRVVFMLWGEEAKRKALLLDGHRHKVLCDDHPRSAGFSECDHFRRANDFLRCTGQPPVCWNIPTCPVGTCAAEPGACQN